MKLEKFLCMNENLMLIVFSLISVFIIKKLKLFKSFSKSLEKFIKIKDCLVLLDEEKIKKIMIPCSEELLKNSLKQILIVFIIILVYYLCKFLSPKFEDLFFSTSGMIKLFLITLLYIMISKKNV